MGHPKPFEGFLIWRGSSSTRKAPSRLGGERSLAPSYAPVSRKPRPAKPTSIIAQVEGSGTVDSGEMVTKLSFMFSPAKETASLTVQERAAAAVAVVAAATAVAVRDRPRSQGR